MLGDDRIAWAVGRGAASRSDGLANRYRGLFGPLAARDTPDAAYGENRATYNGDPAKRWGTCFHEAGHAVADRVLFGAGAVVDVELVPARLRNTLGVTRSAIPETAAESEVMIIYAAGPVAARMAGYNPDFRSDGDRQQVEQRLGRSVHDDEWSSACDSASRLLRENWNDVRAVAELLARDHHVSGREVTAAVDAAHFERCRRLAGMFSKGGA